MHLHAAICCVRFVFWRVRSEHDPKKLERVAFRIMQILEKLHHKKQSYLTSEKQVQRTSRGETPANVCFSGLSI